MNLLSRRLLWHGFFLILLGMLSGFIIPWVANPKMGISTHVDGLLNGCILAATGLVWPHLKLGPQPLQAAFGLSLSGAYLGWATTLLAALWGTRFGAVVSGGPGGSAWQEELVAAGFTLAVIALLSSTLLVLWGLRGKPGGSTRGRR